MEFSNVVKLWEVVHVFHRYTTIEQAFIITAILIVLYATYRAIKSKPPLVDVGKLRKVLQVFRRSTTLGKFALFGAILVVTYAACLVTIYRPPLVVYQLHFVLTTDRQVHRLLIGTDGFEVNFFLRNITSPPEELHNVFGNLWLSGEYFVASTIQSNRGKSGSPRVEWDIQIPVLPKESVLSSATAVLKMPPPGAEILIGAQFVSKETDRQEYLWKIINDAGIPTILFLKNPYDFK